MNKENKAQKKSPTFQLRIFINTELVSVPKKATTYSPTNVVPSALMGLTSLFGMVRGEPHRYNHLKF